MPPPPATGFRRALFVAAGLGFVGMAYLGAVLPGLPTTPWVLAASYCFGRSSPRLQRWLYRTPYFGGLLADWDAHRGMRRSKKLVATAMMATAISCSILFFGLPEWVCWSIAGAGAVGLAVIWGVVRTVPRSKGEEGHLTGERPGIFNQPCEPGASATGGHEPAERPPEAEIAPMADASGR